MAATDLPELEQEDGELVLVDRPVPVAVHLEQLRWVVGRRKGLGKGWWCVCVVGRGKG